MRSMVGGVTEDDRLANEIARRLRRTMTPQEVKLWVRLRALRSQGYHFRRQAPRQAYIVDFACLKHRIVVEVDGSQHGRHAGLARDAERDRTLWRREGLLTLRFWNGDVDADIDGVMETILAALRSRPATPPTALRAVPPPRSGEG